MQQRDYIERMIRQIAAAISAEFGKVASLEEARGPQSAAEDLRRRAAT